MTRLKLLKLLAYKEYCVCELAAIIGISQPGVSQHLQRLKQVGFVTERKDSQWVYYKADEGALHRFQREFAEFLAADVGTIPELEAEMNQVAGLEQNPLVIACKPRRGGKLN